MTTKIRLLIVDDSALFRSQIRQALQSSSEIEIVGAVADGKTAISFMATHEVDICTLDIEMPELDGIGTLKEMRARNLTTKAIMFSSQSKAGAEKTMQAIQFGAVDFVPKPLPDETKSAGHEKIKETLLPKILALFPGKRKVEVVSGQTSVSTTPARLGLKKNPHSHLIWETFRPEILVIASSTGGPNALVDYFGNLKEVLPFPILIAQHMPPLFTASLAERIGASCGKVAREAAHGETLKANHIYIAPGNFHMRLNGDRKTTTVLLDQGPQQNFVRPCADFLFETAASIFGRNVLGIVFTGMGHDGAAGAAAVKTAGGSILIQNEASCVVFGMPGAVSETGQYDFSGNPVELAHQTLSAAKIKRATHVA